MNRQHPGYREKSAEYFKAGICNVNSADNVESADNVDHDYVPFYSDDEKTDEESSIHQTDQSFFSEISHRELREHIRLFLLQLQSIHLVPVRTIQDILSSINQIHNLSKWKIFESIQAVAVRHIINPDVCKELALEVHKSYPFYNLTKIQV